MNGEFRFRTPVEPIRTSWHISHSDRILCLGSCFADEAGRRLEQDGFNVLVNPFGALYNPLSIRTCIARAIADTPYARADLAEGPRGYHCLDYATRFSGPDADVLLALLEDTRLSLKEFLTQQPTIILTLGSAFVYRLADSGAVVGNCHKFPAATFTRSRISVAEATEAILHTAQLLFTLGISRIILTVSPIRHLADGLHGNNLSKSTLMLAADEAAATEPNRICYFPAYEALIDDLRDYRFYAADMKHTYDVAADYVYKIFSDTFFDAATRREALDCRAKYRASLHRPIL
ncbi:MAG: GSCFA domain-containing protein [Muribaculaceae bacterium]|nr:GSCFA domain-containing protein [Muribaculaceae bacterium]